MHLPESTIETKLRKIGELSALAFQRRDACLKQSEDKFFALFENLKSAPLVEFNYATLEALRYAFRFTWAKDDFASVVQAEKNLHHEVLQQEPLLAAYLAASKEQLETSTSPAAAVRV